MAAFCRSSLRFVAGAFALAALASLVGCTLAPNPTPTPTAKRAVPILLILDDQSTLVTGVGYRATLTVINGTCFGLSGAGSQSVAYFPPGTKVVDRGTALDLPRLGVVRVGEVINGGATREPPNAQAPIPTTCLTDDVIYLNEA